MGSTSNSNSNRRVESLASATESLRIYDSEIDMVDHINRGSKRIRIEMGVEYPEEEGTEMRMTPAEKGKEPQQNEDLANGENGVGKYYWGVGVIGDRRTITAEDLKNALKGKSVITEDNGEEKKGGGCFKENIQKRRQADWFRLLSQYSKISNRNSLFINEYDAGKSKTSLTEEWIEIEKEENEIGVKESMEKEQEDGGNENSVKVMEGLL